MPKPSWGYLRSGNRDFSQRAGSVCSFGPFAPSLQIWPHLLLLISNIPVFNYFQASRCDCPICTMHMCQFKVWSRWTNRANWRPVEGGKWSHTAAGKFARSACQHWALSKQRLNHRPVMKGPLNSVFCLCLSRNQRMIKAWDANSPWAGACTSWSITSSAEQVLAEVSRSKAQQKGEIN